MKQLKSPARLRGVGAEHISLPNKGIVRQSVLKLLTYFETISTAHTIEHDDCFLWSKELPENPYQ
jgi:hypothetical protein